MARRRRSWMPECFPINEVEVHERPGDDKLSRTYQALDWLVERGWNSERHYSINMWGGTRGYTSFFFEDHRIAVEFKLHFGGAAPG